LSSNGLTGELPAAWGMPTSLPKLGRLHLQNNMLRGAHPPSSAAIIAPLSTHPHGGGVAMLLLLLLLRVLQGIGASLCCSSSGLMC
jgi:hypothetical protein